MYYFFGYYLSSDAYKLSINLSFDSYSYDTIVNKYLICIKNVNICCNFITTANKY